MSQHASPSFATGRAPAEPSPAAIASAPQARRALRYETMADLLAEVESYHEAPVQSLGKWTPAQNIEHVRLLIHVSHAGTDFTMPLGLRLFARLMKPRLLRSGLKPGLKTVELFEPRSDITLEEAIAAFREDVQIAAQPGAMSHPSPLLGPMSHEQWEQLHCRHAELHFSFIVPASQP